MHLSKTMLSISAISTETTMKDIMTTQVPTDKTITMIGYQETTVTVMFITTDPAPLPKTMINNMVPDP